MSAEEAALIEAALNQRALMAAALTGSLTLMSILTASIGIMYGVYTRFCIPSVPDDVELPRAGQPRSPSLDKYLRTKRPEICEVIVKTSRYVVGALIISAGTALFAALGLLGYRWSVIIVNILLFAEIAVVPMIGAWIVFRFIPR
jgi:amino acid transporter